MEWWRTNTKFAALLKLACCLCPTFPFQNNKDLRFIYSLPIIEHLNVGQRKSCCPTSAEIIVIKGELITSKCKC
jgi:hypothetical protein